MLYTPRKGDVLVQHNLGTVGAANFGTSITAGASAATKGTTTEIIASTNFEAFLVEVFCSEHGTAGTASQACLDILIGAATEEVLIPDLLAGYSGAGIAARVGPKRWMFPLYIPAGSRLSARIASNRTSQTARVGIILYGGQSMGLLPYGTKVVTYGIGSVPNGTAITPGASGAEGSWTQITASTTEDHIALVPSFTVQGDTTTANLSHFVDLGFGAATEEEIAQSYIYRTDSNEYQEGPINPMPCFKDIPSGTRLTMRASCSGTNDSGYHCAVHGVS
jgi:hypothetical protein